MQSLVFLIAVLLSLLSSAFGNKVIFINKDSVPRTICWYPAAVPGSDPAHPIYFPKIPGTYVPAFGHGETPGIVHGGSYMFKSIYLGGDCSNMNNVEGEFTFNGHEGKTYFNLSAVKSYERGLGDQHSQIHFFRVAAGLYPQAGCSSFPCDNLYKFHNDDTHTLNTEQSELTAIICNGSCNAD
ncbi:uncharacterized protein RSE6_08517 [Rhynchosporium secalis]|uniref:Uncharacterized protein n=1 Tax=Rhynchosporium secalis TaxID=38038 RepID=A0A1E1MFK8_RHYSE|nr:uncharacterized protein RSE6_08517 [Rhynchosporium secalis]